jgi:SulP family sulfate permease
MARVAEHGESLAPIVTFRLRNMTAIDATGLRAIEEMASRLRAANRAAIFCGAREQPQAVMARAGFAAQVGAPNLCPNIHAAVARARGPRRAPRGHALRAGLTASAASRNVDVVGAGG